MRIGISLNNFQMICADPEITVTGHTNGSTLGNGMEGIALLSSRRLCRGELHRYKTMEENVLKYLTGNGHKLSWIHA
jgi:hypothetical protein